MATTRVFHTFARPLTSSPSDQVRFRARDQTIPGLREVLWIWGGLGALTVAVLVTYSRFPVSEFYHVSIAGIAGGFSRTLTLLNFPIAFIALSLMGFALTRLYAIPGALSRSERWLVGLIAAITTVMLLVASFVVHQSDLDAKPANAIPAVGVLLALALTLFTARRTGIGERMRWARSDTIRLVAIVFLIAAALPWMIADLGVFVGDIPLIGYFYMSKEVLPGHTLPAVHLGHHHGFDGVIFAISAIVLSRQLGRVTGALRWPLHVYVALMLVYGLANGLQDFWGEQLVKRGWTDLHAPTVAEPKLTPAWGVIALATVVVAAFLMATTRPKVEDKAQTATW